MENLPFEFGSLFQASFPEPLSRRTGRLSRDDAPITRRLSRGPRLNRRRELSDSPRNGDQRRDGGPLNERVAGDLKAVGQPQGDRPASVEGKGNPAVQGGDDQP